MSVVHGESERCDHNETDEIAMYAVTPSSLVNWATRLVLLWQIHVHIKRNILKGNTGILLSTAIAQAGVLVSHEK